MRICLVSKEIAGVRGGGIGVYVSEAGKALSAFGHEVWLLTEDPGKEKRERLKALTWFHRVLVAGENVPADRRQRLFHGGPHYAYSMLVHETLQATGVAFDYIEFPDYEAEGLIPLREQNLFQTYGSAALGVTLHSPTYECFLDDQQMHRASLAIREVCLLEDDAIRNAPVLNCPSTGLAEVVTRRLGLRPDAATIIRYPMNLPQPPTPTAPRASLEELKFLYYGRIEPRKGVEPLIEAFRALPHLRLRLVGGDVPYSPYGRSFRAHLERNAPPNVEFLGEVPRERMLALNREADVCIFPSLFENWPNACIEAMAAGRVVLGSRHGGMSEMIEHGKSGFLVDGRNPADIARVISDDVASHLNRLDQIGHAAASRIRILSDQETYVRAIERRVAGCGAIAAPPKPISARTPKVSIVIPFYKDQATIAEAVQSACRQEHDNLEIVVVNDGSPLRDAVDVLADQSKRDPRIKVVHKPNGGLSSARNCGIKHATGDYLLFLDADNILHPDYASLGVDVLERRPDLTYVVPHAQFFNGETGARLGVYNPVPFDRTTGLLINRFGDAGAMFRRTLFTDHGISYDEVLLDYADWALWMDLNRLGFRGAVIPRVLYDYRLRDDSLVNQVARPNHKDLMGLLIDRHFPVVDPREKDVLVTLFQVAGHAVNDIMRGDPESPSVKESLSILFKSALRVGTRWRQKMSRGARDSTP